MTLEELRARLAEIESEMRALHDAGGSESFTDEQQGQWDGLDNERGELQTQITAAEEVERQAEQAREERRQRVASFATYTRSTEPGDGATRGDQGRRKPDPFEVLEDRSIRGEQRTRALRGAITAALETRDLGGSDNERHVQKLLERHGGDHDWAENLLARCKPAYVSGFAKAMTGRSDYLSEEERAAVAVGTSTNGGLLVPTHLDPTLILTNAGTSNVIRGMARTVTLTTGNTWHGVTTAGVTASWDGELVEVSDDSPAVAAASVATTRAQSLVQASIEAFQDIDNLTSDVLMLFADARDRLEGAAHATGSGTGQPKGIFTAINASASLQVTSAAAAAIGLVDIHSLYRTVPVRWRGRSSFLSNPLYSLAVKALGTAVSASFSTDLTQAPSGSMLGRPFIESDDAPTTQTTTALDPEILFGDFSNYLIVDMPGGFSVEFIPHMFNTANNLPDGRRAWYAYWRNGADAVNAAAFRILVDKTSA